MVRKFNFTGRKKIPSKFISIQKISNGNSNYFIANLDLQKLGFPNDAFIYVEAYHNANFLRFNFGTIQNIKSPIDTSIDELPEIENVLFRVRVVDESTSHGRILGNAERIKPRNDLESGERESILPVKFENLKNQIWKITFDQDLPGPVLVFNNEKNFPGIRIRVQSDNNFFSLIFPAAIRTILTKMADEDKLDRDSDDWSAHWVQFSEDILGVSPTPSHDSPEIDNWIDEIVDSFCLKYNSINRIK